MTIVKLGNCNHLVNNIYDHSIVNIFCFRAFTNKITGVVYDDCTGKFPFMSLDESVCFFVKYHYETNTILATPIPGLDSNSIFGSCTNLFEYLESKGYKPKLNVMDNQATNAIKSYLTPQQVRLQLVKLHNHQVNTTEHAIQTFKNRFIGALSTININFPIQLWDKLPSRFRISSIFSNNQESNQTFQLMKYPNAPMTGTDTL